VHAFGGRGEYKVFAYIDEAGNTGKNNADHVQ
jgi:hypothetical protein